MGGILLGDSSGHLWDCSTLCIDRNVQGQWILRGLVSVTSLIPLFSLLRLQSDILFAVIVARVPWYALT